MPGGWNGVGGSTTQPSTPREAAADVARWWDSFNDPVLSSLITRAGESNLDLQIAGSRVRQARASRVGTASGLWPNLDIGAGYRRSGSGPGEDVRVQTGQDLNGDGIPDTVTRSGGSNGARGLYDVGLDASWEIDVFGGLRRGVEAADADTRAAVWDYRDVLVTLVSEVGLTYVDLRSIQRQLAIANQNLALQKQTADLTRRRFAGGFVSGLDVANSDAIVAETASRIPSLEASARQDIYALSVLLGQEPTKLLEELSTTAPIPTTPPDVPVGIPSDVLQRRPDLRRAEEDLHAATARVGVAESDLFPRFSLTGSWGLQNEKASRVLDYDNRAWSFGPSVSWPLFDAGRIRSNINVQKESQLQALLTYRSSVLVALQDVENALIAYVNEQQRRKSLTEALAANRRAFDIATQLYQLGQTDFLNVLTAQRSLLSSEDSLAQSDRTIATNLISLYKALGGGWE